jgi:GT2 family glycosyltransferase/glycosyltransferase involved in cell wall biosynthesis
MIKAFDRSYQGLNRYIRGVLASSSSEPTPLMVGDFLSHHRISFLPLTLTAEDAYRIDELIGGSGIIDRGASARSNATESADELVALVETLWDAVRFTRLRGILVLTCPENPAARDAFESLGLGACLFVGVEELLRSLDRIARFRLEKFEIGARETDAIRPDSVARTRIRFDKGESPDNSKTIRLDSLGSPSSETAAIQAFPETDTLRPMLTDIFEQETHAIELRRQILEGRKRVFKLERELTRLEREHGRLNYELTKITESLSWTILAKILRLKMRLMPEESRRARIWRLGMRCAKTVVREGPGRAIAKTETKVRSKIKSVYSSRRSRRLEEMTEGHTSDCDEKGMKARRSDASVDIVICIHNALDDVRQCLDSVLLTLTSTTSLILVDDGSAAETAEYVSAFARKHGCELIRNEIAGGYTRAANQGLRHSRGDFVVLLNSDTIVSPEWIERLLACAESDPRIGLVGPLSNTASWQSIPELVSRDGDWAENPLEEGTSPADMAMLVARHADRLYPRLPFLNGFCLMIRRAVLDEVGLFDEEKFGRGYGEENDYCLRAGTANWQLAVADDVYVYHRQSRSYSNERRKALCERATATLLQKHGAAVVDSGVAYCRENRILAGIRARARFMTEREDFIRLGSERWNGKRVLFLLPTMSAGGGSNVVIQEAAVMRRMGVDAQLFNYRAHRSAFESSYKDLEIPVIYGDCEDSVLELASQFDALIATIYFSVRMLAPLQDLDRPPVLGYYVQDYEPYFFKPGTGEYREAHRSYTLVPDIVRFTKTDWNRDEVWREAGVDCHVVSPSVNVDLFRPRPRRLPTRPGVTRVAAMVRPHTEYREPELTMKILEKMYIDHRGSVEFQIFGCDSLDPAFLSLPRRFPWKNAGISSPAQLSELLNEVDVFADFSSHQAMGLTAMEAMASGATVIVPSAGGAEMFVEHERNGLVVDSRSFADCAGALSRLIEDESLRKRLQNQALNDICRFFPERASYNILGALFPGSRILTAR